MLQRSYHYDNRLPAKLREQIERHPDQQVTAPSESEAQLLCKNAEQGDKQAIEQVFLLYYLMPPAFSEQCRIKTMIENTFNNSVKLKLYEH
jgi:hypothetical protein